MSAGAATRGDRNVVVARRGNVDGLRSGTGGPAIGRTRTGGERYTAARTEGRGTACGDRRRSAGTGGINDNRR